MFPIQCQQCGTTGEILRVTANLRCPKCASSDIDLWDGEKTASGPTWGPGFGRNPDDDDDEEEDVYPSTRELVERANRAHREQQAKQSSSPGTGWTHNQPDTLRGWDEYAGPTPGESPRIDEKNDADASSTCPICHGTGNDPRASGGGYEENVCRNCHGTGKVESTSNNDSPALDAHVKSGPPLGGAAHPTATIKIGNQEFPIEIQVGGGGGSVATKADPKQSKIAKMSAKIREVNPGVTQKEAHELARRAVEKFPER